MNKICEVCGEAANVLCMECKKYLCIECDTFLHGKERNKTHTREKISKNLPVDTKCPEHTKHPLEYFCEDDYGTPIAFVETYCLKL